MRRLLGWPDKKALAITGLGLLLLGAYTVALLGPIVAPATPRADDFQDYLWAAHRIAVGGDPYGNFTRTRVPWDWSLNSGYIYPAVFAAVLVPLTWIGNDLAVRIWLLFIQACVVASVVLIYARIGRPKRGELLALVAVLTTFFPLINTMWTGAMNAILLLLLTAGWAAWDRRQDLRSGVLIGLAAVFKVFPVALLPYLAWRRDWRLVAAALVTGAAGLLACLMVTGVDHNLYYFRDVLPHLAGGTGYRENQSLAGLAARLCQPSTADHGGGAGWCGRLVAWPSTLVLIGLLAVAVRRPVRSSLEFALAMTALPLISTVTWSFHLVVLIFPIVVLVRAASEHTASRGQTRLLLLAWLCFSVGPAAHYALIFAPLPSLPGLLDLVPQAATRIAAESYLIGTGVVFASLWLIIRRQRAQAAIPTRLAA
ncbi:MAG: glycosyltransferase family 87 protein [Candidatus Dormibacter sp.]